MHKRAFAPDAGSSDEKTALIFPFVLICAGVVVLPAPLRELLLGETAKAVNFLSWLGLFLVPLSLKPVINIGKAKARPFLIALALASLLAISVPADARDEIPLDLFAFVLPVLIIFWSAEKRFLDLAQQFLPWWCCFLNGAVVVIALGGLADLAFDHVVTRFFSELYGNRSYAGLLSEGRMVSFYGHSLVSATMVITAFCSNHLLSIMQRREPSAFLLVFYVLTMALTTSKSGFLLVLAGVILITVRERRIKSLLLIGVGLVAATSYGLLDTVIARLSAGAESGDFTTGRNSSLEALLKSGSLAFRLFTGQALDSSNVDLIAALEYPLLRFGFKYGIAFAILFAISFFFYPLVKLLRKSPRLAFLSWIIMTISVNTYSGITTYSDVLLIQSITTALALAVAYDPVQWRPHRQ